MAIFYTAQSLKRNGPQYLKDNVADVYVCENPLKTDSVATIVSKAIATVAFLSADVSLVDVGNDLQVNLNAKSDIDPSGTIDAIDELAVVYCSATENLLCIDATDREITNQTGDLVNIPAGRYTVPELVSV